MTRTPEQLEAEIAELRARLDGKDRARLQRTLVLALAVLLLGSAAAVAYGYVLRSISDQIAL